MNLDNNKSQNCIVQQTTNYNVFVQQLIIAMYLEQQTANHNDLLGQQTNNQS